MIILQYSDACTKLRLSCFVLGKCIVSYPLASEVGEGSKGLGSSGLINGNFSS